MCPDHRLVDAAVPALEDLAVLVDEEVVADVVPAISLYVVDLDTAHDCRRLTTRVVVRPGRVMHDRVVDAVAVLGRRTTDRLVCLPPEARDDEGRARDL